MSQVEINQFIQNIADNQVSYDLKRFFEIVHKKFFQNVDISFINYFLELSEKQDEFCVNHSKLYEYNVIKDKNENTQYIEKCLVDDNDLVEGEDYLVRQVTEVRMKSTGGSTENVTKNVYMLKPKTFKFCLMRSKNCKNYSKYYLLLEEMYLYFTKYEKAYKDVLLSGKNCQINELIKKVDNQNEMIEKQKEEFDEKFEELNNQIQELLYYGKEANEKLDENNYILRVTNQELEDTSKDVKKLKKIYKTSISELYN